MKLLQCQKIQGKQFIITGINFCTQWPIAKAVPQHVKILLKDSLYIRSFKKFGPPVKY